MKAQVIAIGARGFDRAPDFKATERAEALHTEFFRYLGVASERCLTGPETRDCIAVIERLLTVSEDQPFRAQLKVTLRALRAALPSRSN